MSPSTHVTATFEYDGLNRLTSKTFNDGTPTVTLRYDDNIDITGHTSETNYPIGRLVQTTATDTTATPPAVVSQNTLRYDVAGRVKSSRQTTGAIPYIFGYAYNLAGALTSETYPSGRSVTTEYDTAGRPASLGGTASYIDSVKYAAHGAPTQLQLHNDRYEETCYNNRLQVKAIRLGATSTLTAGQPTCQDADSDLLNLGFGYDLAGRMTGIMGM